MLLAYGAKNFYCFKEGVEISFKVGSSCPTTISKGKHYSNILCVKGANASGKTNVLKIPTFLSDFCVNSFNKKPDAEIPFKTFFSNNRQSEFYAEFEMDGIFYRYELTVTKKSVKRETLYRKGKRIKKVLERKGNDISFSTKEFEELKSMKLRSNASIISTANQYEIESLNPVYKSFKPIVSNVNFFGLADRKWNLSKTSKMYKEVKPAFGFVKKVITGFDLGIKDILIESEVTDNGEKKYWPVFIHEVDGNDKHLLIEAESSGTKALYFQLRDYIFVLLQDGLLVLDEFDINLHPHILPKLLDLFTEEDGHSAQIIFTTHNTDVIDYLGKYRTIIVEKENNESYAFRLDEIPGELIRNDRPISPLYNEGKIGGVPNL